MKTKMVNRILLKDSVDEFFTDLVTFKKDVDLFEVVTQLSEFKKENLQDYTNEDIYYFLDKNFGIESIDFIGNLDSVVY